MNTPHDGGPISASIDASHAGSLIAHGGLSIRDWFAGMAMQSLAGPTIEDTLKRGRDANKAKDQLAHGCYAIADAMLDARNK